MTSYPLTEFAAAIEGVEMTMDPRRIRVKSRDRYAVSPLLRTMLEGKQADVVVTPKTIEELKRVVSAAVRYRIPITERGGGSANYGQSVPLRGGILLDMSVYAGMVELKPGMARAKAGTLVIDIDKAAREIGWELRVHPTTARIATIAGHIAGGTGGPGSVVYGILRDRGNIAGAQVLTMEEEPRLIELRGPDAQLIHHTYGATGIITEVEMPLAPAWPWIEAIVAFPEYMQAVRFGVTLANEAGINRKVVSVQEWPTPKLIRQFADIVPEGHSICSTMIAKDNWEDFESCVASFGGTIVSSAPEGKGPYGGPIWEFVFGHALFQIQKTEPGRSVVEGFFRDAAGEGSYRFEALCSGAVDGAAAKIRAAFALRRRLRRDPADVIVSMGNLGHATPYLACLGKRRPRRIYRISNEIARGDGLRGALRSIWMRLLIGDAARMPLVGRALAANPVFAAALADGRAIELASGVDGDRARELARAPSPHCWFDDPVPVVLAIGRLRPQKNFGLLIRAAGRLRRERPIRLAIIGGGSAEERAALAGEAASAGLGEDFLLAGETANVFAWLARASAFVLPSRWEGSSIALLEAMAVGTPVVASRLAGDAAQVLDEGRYGLLCDGHDDEELALAIARQLSADAVRPRGRAAHYPVPADAYLTLIEEVCDGSVADPSRSGHRIAAHPSSARNGPITAAP